MADQVQTSSDGGKLGISSNGGVTQVQSGQDGMKTGSPQGGSHVATEADAAEAQTDADKAAGITAPEGTGDNKEGDATSDAKGATGAKEDDGNKESKADDNKGKDDSPKSLELSDPRLQEFQKEWDNTGEVSKESRTKIAEEFGVSAEFVDLAIAGMEGQFKDQQAAVDKQVSAIKDEFGGDEGYTEFVTWAKDNLSPEQIAAYDGLESEGNLSAMLVMAQAFNAQFKTGGNATRRDIVNEADAKRTPSGASAFESQAQMLAAMEDPRYAVDPAYRKVVDARIGAM